VRDQTPDVLCDVALRPHPRFRSRTQVVLSRQEAGVECLCIGAWVDTEQLRTQTQFLYEDEPAARGVSRTATVP
jgi:hypothetical protein